MFYQCKTQYHTLLVLLIYMFDYVKGYRQNKAFLVGPGPMKSTVVDFWQMIWENKCYAIVLLGQLLENKKVRNQQIYLIHANIFSCRKLHLSIGQIRKRVLHLVTFLLSLNLMIQRTNN